MSKRDLSPSDNPRNDSPRSDMSEPESEAIPPAAPFERWLDTKLKSVYGAVLEEPVPQDLINLLREKLDKKD